MNIRVLLHIGFLMEPFSTVLAGIRSGTAMDKEMGAESRGTLESLPTMIALK